MLDQICVVETEYSYEPPEAPALIKTDCDCQLYVPHEKTFDERFICNDCNKLICEDCKHEYDGVCPSCYERREKNDKK